MARRAHHWVILESTWARCLWTRERDMAQERLPMRKVREVLRLKAAGLGKRKIAASLGVSATAAGACLRRAREAGIAWAPAEELTHEALEAPAHSAPLTRPPP